MFAILSDSFKFVKKNDIFIYIYFFIIFTLKKAILYYIKIAFFPLFI